MTSSSKKRDDYHHGNLPEVLRQEAVKLLAEKGVDGFSLREVARRAGVAVAAPSHHFGNAKGLLTSIATEGFAKLRTEQALALESGEGAQDSVVRMCLAYTRLGSSHAGHAAIMFRLDMLNAEDADFRTESIGAFDGFKEAVETAAEPNARYTHIVHAAKTLWAAMHGLMSLKMIDEDEVETLVRFAVRSVLGGLESA